MQSRIGLVLGAPRSGTTFLLEAVAAASGVDAVAGRVFPSQIGPIVAAGVPASVEEALAFSLRFSLGDAVRWHRQSRAEVIASMVRGQTGLLEAPGRLLGRSVPRMLVYKEPFLTFAPAFAAGAIPDARIVYLQRDGRDVADSLVRTYDVLSDDALRSGEYNEMVPGRVVGDRRVPFWVSADREDDFLGSSQFTRAIWMWREMVARWGAEEATVRDRSDVMVVPYESLMADPLARGHEVLRHLGLRPSARVDRRLERAHTRSIGTHRRRAPAEIGAAEEIAGSELRALGYLDPPDS